MLYRKNIISHSRKFLTLESYKSVEGRGPAFKLLSEGFFILIVTLSLSRFIVSCFFGREVGFSVPSYIISFYIVITQNILSAVALYVINFYNILEALLPRINLIFRALNVLFMWVGFASNRSFNYRSETLKFSNFVSRRVPTKQKVNYMLRDKVYFSTNRCEQDLVDGNSLKTQKVNLNPNWVTGFTDGSGSFMISIIKSKDRALG